MGAMSVKVFIVDQSPIARQLLTKVLAGAGDFDVVGESGTGEGCLIMLEEDEPDVVFLDMANTGGKACGEIVAQIKKIRPQTKVILCANPNKKYLIMEASEMGADDFIDKPFHQTRIARAINHVMGVE